MKSSLKVLIDFIMDDLLSGLIQSSSENFHQYLIETSVENSRKILLTDFVGPGACTRITVRKSNRIFY